MKNVKSFATILLEKSFLNKMKDIIQEKATKFPAWSWRYKLKPCGIFFFKFCGHLRKPHFHCCWASWIVQGNLLGPYYTPFENAKRWLGKIQKWKCQIFGYKKKFHAGNQKCQNRFWFPAWNLKFFGSTWMFWMCH